MIKKLFIHIILILFTTSVVAEEIIISCKYSKYKYIIKDSGNNILSTNKKLDKGKYYQWCPMEPKNAFPRFISASGPGLLLSDLKGVCMVDVAKFKTSDGSVGVLKNATSVVDFKKLIYKTEYFWKDEKKKYKRKEKCKKVKK